MASVTKFNYLNQHQRDDFMKRWYCLKQTIEKWIADIGPDADISPDQAIPIFANKKNLEQEIEDLEDISLSAYRAMKCLKQKIDFFESGSIMCPCGKGLTNTGYIQALGNLYCNLECFKEFKQNAAKINKEIFYSCGDCGKQLSISYVSIYGKHFCDVDCVTNWERDYEHDSYAG